MESRSEISKTDNKKIPADILNLIEDAYNNISFGTILITIHDADIVQIDATKKNRFKK